MPLPQSLRYGAVGGGTSTGDQLKDLTLKIYFTHTNTSIKADFLKTNIIIKRSLLDIVSIFQTFKILFKNCLNVLIYLSNFIRFF